MSLAALQILSAAHRLHHGIAQPVSTKSAGYVSVTSGTCQRHGHQPLKTKEECREAALALGFKDDWGPHGGYADVVDGCSVRFTTDLFLNPAGTCKVGATTPRWIPLLNGKTECECSTYQPCLCQGEAGVHVFRIKLWCCAVKWQGLRRNVED